MRFLAVIFSRITLVSGTGTTLLFTTTIVIRILLVVFFVVVFIFLFFLFGKRVRFGDLSEIRLLGIFSRDNPLFDQFIELCDENILYLQISKDWMPFLMDKATLPTYLDDERIFICLGHRTVICLRIMRNLKAGSAVTVSILRRRSANSQIGEGRDPYQCAISHEIRELLVLSLVDLRLEDAESHWLFDDIVIIRHIALVNTAMEQFRGITATGD